MRLVPTDREGLVKDLDSGAILSVDNAKLAAYRKKKAAAEEAHRSAQRIDRLEGDVSEIKQMLKALTEMLKK